MCMRQLSFLTSLRQMVFKYEFRIFWTLENKTRLRHTTLKHMNVVAISCAFRTTNTFLLEIELGES